jgi:hypothetical protein
MNGGGTPFGLVGCDVLGGGVLGDCVPVCIGDAEREDVGEFEGMSGGDVHVLVGGWAPAFGSAPANEGQSLANIFLFVLSIADGYVATLGTIPVLLAFF